MGVVDIFGNQVTGQGLATKPTYNFAEKMSAASNMTVLGSMFRGLKVTPEDERAATERLQKLTEMLETTDGCRKKDRLYLTLFPLCRKNEKSFDNKQLQMSLLLT